MGDPASATRLAVVIPLANEQDTVTELLSRVVAQLGDEDRVYCVLDTVTKDRTRELVDALATEEGRIRCIWAPENRSVVDAYFRGYRVAVESGARWILEMDGGLSHSPEEIPRFIAAMESGAQYAGGCRFMKGASWSGPPSRYIVSRGGTALANLVLGTRMRDMTSGFECFGKEAMEMVLTHGVHSRAHFFQTEIRTLMHAFRWVEVPISYCSPSRRLAGSNITEALRNLWMLRRESRRRPAQRSSSDE
jgi:dolichol-phosphate mannosyltransferase